MCNFENFVEAEVFNMVHCIINLAYKLTTLGGYFWHLEDTLRLIVSQQKRMFPVTILSLVFAQVNLGFFVRFVPGTNPLTKVK